MNLIERIDEAEVIAEFLRAEIDSPRFGERVRARLATDGYDERIVRQADTTDDAANRYRAMLLHSYRGVGGSAPLLEGLPDAIEWHRASIAPEALGSVRYIDYPYWNELSGGTRSPARAAQRIREGITAMGRSNDGFIALAKRLCAGESLGAPVLIAPTRADPPVILEGHTRVTAMLLRPECLPAPVELLIGYAAGVREWMYYGSPEARP